MFGTSLDTGGGGISSSSSSGGDNTFGATNNNVVYGNSGLQLDNTKLAIIAVVLVVGFLAWGRK